MKSGEHFDVIIIGAGPSGIFCAYEHFHDDPGSNDHAERDHIVGKEFLFCCTFHGNHLHFLVQFFAQDSGRTY